MYHNGAGTHEVAQRKIQCWGDKDKDADDIQEDKNGEDVDPEVFCDANGGDNESQDEEFSSIASPRSSSNIVAPRN